MSQDCENSPPNEPPLRRFLVSFVLLPAAIVLVGLSLVVGIRWLTHRGSSPKQLVDAIERGGGNARWRAAAQLAAVLADPAHAKRRRDRELAARLTGVLRRELESGRIREEDVMLRVFLCRALGEFVSPEPLPVLVDATDPRMHPDVRRSALEAIALLIDNLGRDRALEQSGLWRALLAASRDGKAAIRSTAAYTLGILGTAPAEERLAAMLRDENRLVRYNAATGLARWGNSAAVDVLLKMLALDLANAEANGRAGVPWEARRESIRLNALRALQQLVVANPEAPRKKIEKAVRRLRDATESAAVAAEIEKLRKILATQATVSDEDGLIQVAKRNVLAGFVDDLGHGDS